MSTARRAVGLQHFDGDRTRRARARDMEIRQARRAVGRGVLPAVAAEDGDAGEVAA